MWLAGYRVWFAAGLGLLADVILTLALSFTMLRQETATTHAPDKIIAARNLVHRSKRRLRPEFGKLMHNKRIGRWRVNEVNASVH